MTAPEHVCCQRQCALYLAGIILLALLIAVLGVGITQSRLIEFRLSGADSAIFAQLLQHVLDGRGMTTTINPPHVEQHWFGFHFSPILYLVVPLYALFPSILTLNILHSVLICAAAVPLYLLLYRITQRQRIAFWGAILYLINPFIINAAAWDFHEIAFAPLVMVGLLWAVLEKRKVLFILCCLLLICIKEHYGLAVAGAGVLWWHEHRDARFGFMVAAAGILALILIVGFIMPHVSPANSAAMLAGDPALDRYSWIKTSDNWRLLPSLIESNLTYLLILLGATLFASIGRIWWLLPAIADLGAIMLSSNDIMRSANSYHSAPVLVVVIVAAFFYAKSLPCDALIKWLKASGLMTAALACLYVPYPISSFHNLWELKGMHWQVPSSTRATFDHIKHIIPPTEPIAVHTVLMGYFPPGTQMYSFPHRYDNVSWVVQRLDFDLKEALHVASMPFNAHISEYLLATDALISDPSWQPVLAEDKIVVWHRSAGGPAELSGELMTKITGWRQEMINNYCKVSHKKAIFNAPCERAE